MANFKRLARMLVLPMAGACVAACAPIFAEGLDWQSLIGAEAAHDAAPPGTGYYESAVTAIDGRHYALALDYLQAARALNPGDVRVENAFGVVYDKLGRFDLSTRYYAKAKVLDPKSAIVAENLAYSRKLQGLAEGDAPALADGAVPSSQPALDAAQTASLSPQQITVAGPQTAANAPNPNIIELKPVAVLTPPEVPAPKPRAVVTLAVAGSTARTQLHAETAGNIILLTGRPLVVVNGSGQSGATRPVRASLSGLGWTVSSSAERMPRAQSESVVMYHGSMSAVAKALIRTLPFHADLVADNQTDGLKLIVGRNFLNFKPGRQVPQIWRKQIAQADGGKTGVR
jgi:LytR cell envelope-related transcriptional attenuator